MNLLGAVITNVVLLAAYTAANQLLKKVQWEICKDATRVWNNLQKRFNDETLDLALPCSLRDNNTCTHCYLVRGRPNRAFEQCMLLSPYRMLCREMGQKHRIYRSSTIDAVKLETAILKGLIEIDRIEEERFSAHETAEAIADIEEIHLIALQQRVSTYQSMLDRSHVYGALELVVQLQKEMLAHTDYAKATSDGLRKLQEEQTRDRKTYENYLQIIGNNENAADRISAHPSIVSALAAKLNETENNFHNLNEIVKKLAQPHRPRLSFHWPVFSLFSWYEIVVCIVIVLTGAVLITICICCLSRFCYR